jgi:hypothetical protein
MAAYVTTFVLVLFGPVIVALWRKTGLYPQWLEDWTCAAVDWIHERTR